MQYVKMPWVSRSVRRVGAAVSISLSLMGADDHALGVTTIRHPFWVLNWDEHPRLWREQSAQEWRKRLLTLFNSGFDPWLQSAVEEKIVQDAQRIKWPADFQDIMRRRERLGSVLGCSYGLRRFVAYVDRGLQSIQSHDQEIAQRLDTLGRNRVCFDELYGSLKGKYITQFVAWSAQKKNVNDFFNFIARVKQKADYKVALEQFAQHVASVTGARRKVDCLQEGMAYLRADIAGFQEAREPYAWQHALIGLSEKEALMGYVKKGYIIRSAMLSKGVVAAQKEFTRVHNKFLGCFMEIAALRASRLHVAEKISALLSPDALEEKKFECSALMRTATIEEIFKKTECAFDHIMGLDLRRVGITSVMCGWLDGLDFLIDEYAYLVAELKVRADLMPGVSSEVDVDMHPAVTKKLVVPPLNLAKVNSVI